MSQRSVEPEGTPEAFAGVVWCLVCFNMYGMAIFGGLFFALGLASFVADVPGLWLGGREVRTADQKFAWTVSSAGFGLLGGGFVWLHRTGRVIGPR